MKKPASSEKSGPRAPAHEGEGPNAEMMHLLIDSVRDYAIIFLDPDGNVLTWNPAAERLKGWTAPEIIGQHFSRFYTREDIEQGKTAMELEAAAREGRFEDEGWRVRKDGTRFWANVVVTALRDKDHSSRKTICCRPPPSATQASRAPPRSSGCW